MPLITGGKMSNIGEMKTGFDMPVPEGFVHYLFGFKRFIEYHALADRTERIAHGA